MSQSEVSLPPCLAGFLTDEDIAAMMPKRVYPDAEFWNDLDAGYAQKPVEPAQ